jgi:hypothetical protein
MLPDLAADASRSADLADVAPGHRIYLAATDRDVPRLGVARTLELRTRGSLRGVE